MPLNKVPARFAPEVLRDYWRNRALAALLLVVVGLLCWWSWERLPHREATSVVVTGTIEDLQPGLPSGGKYTQAHGRLAVIDVLMPGGGVQRFTGDGRLLERCRRGDRVHLARYGNNLGQSGWALKANACGGAAGR